MTINTLEDEKNKGHSHLVFQRNQEILSLVQKSVSRKTLVQESTRRNRIMYCCVFPVSWNGGHKLHVAFRKVTWILHDYEP